MKTKTILVVLLVIVPMFASAQLARSQVDRQSQVGQAQVDRLIDQLHPEKSAASLVGIVIRGLNGELAQAARPYAEDYIRKGGDEVGLSYDELRRVSREYDTYSRNKWVQNPPETGSLIRPDCEAVFTFSIHSGTSYRSAQLGRIGSGQSRTSSTSVDVTVTYRDAAGRTIETRRGRGSAEDTSFGVSIRTRGGFGGSGTVRVNSEASRRDELALLAVQRALASVRKA